jgi:aminopeptidase-like protein
MNIDALSSELRNRAAALPFARFPFQVKAFIKLLEALPDDAIFVRSYEDNISMQWGVIIHSKEFKELKEGDEIPRLDARVTVNGSEINAKITIPVSASSFLEELGKI